ncbi:uncharacterized protein LOC131892263 [Tigriopus californicus]|uniref:uncharacterized protein LOC131892263 n=1 Tax=Tigriopus californicus TaxID=6832 RepID=UPI0027DA917E|nr:uncharacterized protein LOC131892263 [Tigriopus californicus]
MMIATTCLLVTLLIVIQEQVGNSHVVTFRQATEWLKSYTPRISVGEIKDRLEIDEGSGIMETMPNEGSGVMETMPNEGECSGVDEEFTISLPNPSGCYIFQTTGFNMEGYPNNTGSFDKYFCDYTIEFGANVSGTVTVKEKDFQFQEPNSDGDCGDLVFILGVNDEQQELNNSDSDDRDPCTNSLIYCGTITGDKIRDFSDDELFIRLAADDTENGNRAEIVICIT